MNVLFYSTKDFEVPYLNKANHTHLKIDFTEAQLSLESVNMSKGYECISVFTADDVSKQVVEQLHLFGVKYIAVRAAGHDNVDTQAAGELGMHVANVPEYSPYAVAEHTVAMILALNRKISIAHEQVHKYDFTLGNLVGFDLHQKTLGIIGTGRIGKIAASIMHGFGCKLLGHDVEPSSEMSKKYDLKYCSLEELVSKSDIITLHIPLNDQTKYILDKKLFSIMKRGVMIVNTARGALVNTGDLIDYLEKGIIGSYGMDVYEKERGLFFINHTGKRLEDPMLNKLLSMKNVLITPHQGFATTEALTNIADTTFYNILEWRSGMRPENELTHSVNLISAQK